MKPMALLITGTSGAGKTTISKELLKTLPGVWAYINQDEIRQLVVAGYASADDYSKNWSPETVRQWNVSIPICTDMVKRYLENGISCIVDFYAPPKEFQLWAEMLEGVEYKLVVLNPSEEVAVERNAGREQRGRLKENKIRQNHAVFQAWKSSKALIIETSKQTTSASAKAVLQILDLG